MSRPSEEAIITDTMMEQHNNKAKAKIQIEPALLDRFSNLSFVEDQPKPSSTSKVIT
jgi:hypothetical protein